jgi:hypothetical protein
MKKAEAAWMGSLNKCVRRRISNMGVGDPLLASRGGEGKEDSSLLRAKSGQMPILEVGYVRLFMPQYRPSIYAIGDN